MLTIKLQKVYSVTEKLVKFLQKREWEQVQELEEIIENAEEEIEQIQNKVVSEILSKLEGSYLEEAKCWSSNKMTDFNGNPIRIKVAEQRKADVELKRIKKTINDLKGISS